MKHWWTKSILTMGQETKSRVYHHNSVSSVSFLLRMVLESVCFPTDVLCVLPHSQHNCGLVSCACENRRERKSGWLKAAVEVPRKEARGKGVITAPSQSTIKSPGRFIFPHKSAKHLSLVITGTWLVQKYALDCAIKQK